MKRFPRERGSWSVMNEPLILRSVPMPAEVLPFEGFFEAEYTHLCEALYLLTGDPFEAEEVAQEAMTRVLKRWERIRSMDSPTGYVYRTAMNLNRNRIRRIAVRARRVLHDEPSQDHSSTVGDQQDVRRALAKTLRTRTGGARPRRLAPDERRRGGQGPRYQGGLGAGPSASRVARTCANS